MSNKSLLVLGVIFLAAVLLGGWLLTRSSDTIVTPIVEEETITITDEPEDSTIAVDSSTSNTYIDNNPEEAINEPEIIE